MGTVTLPPIDVSKCCDCGSSSSRGHCYYLLESVYDCTTTTASDAVAISVNGDGLFDVPNDGSWHRVPRLDTSSSCTYHMVAPGGLVDEFGGCTLADWGTIPWGTGGWGGPPTAAKPTDFAGCPCGSSSSSSADDGPAPCSCPGGLPATFGVECDIKNYRGVVDVCHISATVSLVTTCFWRGTAVCPMGDDGMAGVQLYLDTDCCWHLEISLHNAVKSNRCTGSTPAGSWPDASGDFDITNVVVG